MWKYWGINDRMGSGLPLVIFFNLFNQSLHLYLNMCPTLSNCSWISDHNLFLCYLSAFCSSWSLVLNACCVKSPQDQSRPSLFSVTVHSVSRVDYIIQKAHVWFHLLSGDFSLFVVTGGLWLSVSGFRLHKVYVQRRVSLFIWLPLTRGDACETDFCLSLSVK